MLDLVGNPEDRFSRIMAHIIFCVYAKQLGVVLLKLENLFEKIKNICMKKLIIKHMKHL